MSAEAEIWRSTRAPGRIWLYTLRSEHLIVCLTNYGARVVSIEAPDREGEFADITLGYDHADQYLDDLTTHVGATVGRFANRIAGGQFSLDGKTFQAERNRQPNTLHGGSQGFDKKIWTGVPMQDAVRFLLTSADGEMGFPGVLDVSVTFQLRSNTLDIAYECLTDAPTIVNLTNHTYFNLGGDSCNTIESHELLLRAGRYLPVGTGLIPTGEIASVVDTPFDFRNPRLVGEGVGNPSTQLAMAGGYDHTLVLERQDKCLTEAAILYEPSSGRRLTISTTEPGIQFYSGNFLNGTYTGRRNTLFTKRRALCLETQHFPDSPHHAHFPSTLLRPGEVFRSLARYCFSAPN